VHQLIDQRPVEQVSWLDAIRFCNKLSQNDGCEPYYNITGEAVRIPDDSGVGYRLPTEAEWEYSCRAGTRGKYSLGEEQSELGEYAWYASNSNNVTHAVGSKRPNAFGLHDMQGNVWEWCFDWYNDRFYEHSPEDSPRGPDDFRAAFRVCRGGGWFVAPRLCRSAMRNGLPPDEGRNLVGFRLARNIPATVADNLAKPPIGTREPSQPASPPQASDRLSPEKNHGIRVVRNFKATPDYKSRPASEPKGLLPSNLPKPILALTFDADCNDDKSRVSRNAGAVHVEGRVGKGVRFNGTTFMSVAGSFPDNTKPRTLAVWLKADTGPVNHNVHVVTYGPHEPTHPFGIMEAGGNWRYFDWDGGLGTELIVDKTWHHHAVSYDGRVIRYFFDGRVVAETYRSLKTLGKPLILGTAFPGDTHGFVGRMDELVIYDVALDLEQVRAVTERGIQGKHPDGSSRHTR
jgi:sulfatase modifying factor 1